MKTFEVALEVGPIPKETVERLKAAGHQVYRGRSSWRVQTTVPVLGRNSVRAQAHALALRIIDEFGLERLTDPPVMILRDPDGPLDDRPDLILADARRALDPQPLARQPRRWYQRVMELGLGERKGD